MHFAGNKKGRKKNMNFELNLVPFIDVLSTCICFLLVTAVFINLGSFHVSQAVGSEKTKQEEKQGSVTVSLGSRGDIRFEVKDVKGLRGSQAMTTISGDAGQVNFKRTEEWIKAFASQYSDVKTVLLMPNPSSKYDDLIQLMAQFKTASMDQIGIAPL
ncbi:MAG: biopolymer transporter ExbD [Bdellovibrionales bacterium]|nr:biopolymer transporter ExbD [Bdellovibrionales bacterium]